MSAGVGSSVSSAVSGSGSAAGSGGGTSAGAGNVLGLIGCVQFIAATSNLCSVNVLGEVPNYFATSAMMDPIQSPDPTAPWFPQR